MSHDVSVKVEVPSRCTAECGCVMLFDTEKKRYVVFTHCEDHTPPLQGTWKILPCGCHLDLRSYELKQLCQQHSAPPSIQANESVGDSFLDLANYAIFGYMFFERADFSNDAAFFHAYKQVLQVLLEVTQDRRKKYGPGNLLIHRERGLVVRLADKLSRLTHHYFPQEPK